MNFPIEFLGGGRLCGVIETKGGLPAAYQAVRDRDDTWQMLRNSFVGNNPLITLELIDLRRRDVPYDPWLLDPEPSIYGSMNGGKKHLEIALERWKKLTAKERTESGDLLAWEYAIAGRWEDALRTMPKGEDALSQIASNMADWRQWSALHAFLRVHGSKLPADQARDFKIRERIHAGAWKDARHLLRKAKDEEKIGFDADYLQMGRFSEAVRLHRKRPGWEQLADEAAEALARGKKTAELRRLVNSVGPKAEHASRYRADLLLLEGKAAEADLLMTKEGIDKADVCPTFFRIRAARGLAARTMQELGDRVDNHAIFQACFDAGDAAQLEEVIRRSRRPEQDDPDSRFSAEFLRLLSRPLDVPVLFDEWADHDSELERWHAMVFYLRGDDRTFVERCRSLMWRDPRIIEPYRIRSLVRLGRGEEAVAASYRLLSFDYRPYRIYYLFAHFAWRERR